MPTFADLDAAITARIAAESANRTEFVRLRDMIVKHMEARNIGTLWSEDGSSCIGYQLADVKQLTSFYTLAEASRRLAHHVKKAIARLEQETHLEEDFLMTTRSKLHEVTGNCPV